LLNRYSTSQSLQVVLRPSRQRRYFLLLLALALALAVYQVYDKSFPYSAAVLALLSVVLLLQGWPDPMKGAVLLWQGGEWFVQHGGRQTSAQLLPGSVRLPWLVYVALQETHAGQRWRFWLFPDSADADQLRQLRCRLIMEK